MFLRLQLVKALALVMVLAGAAPLTVAAPGTSKATASASASETHPIDINTADGAAFESVPGIGKSLSQRILSFREKNGPFQTVDDLLKVQGIGEKSIQKLRPYLTVARAK